MENLGPAPIRDNAGRPPLSSARAAVLEYMQRGGGPIRAADAADHFGQHVNTVREHLDELVGMGLVVRHRARSAGRGRPAWLYEANPNRAEPDLRVREYTAFAGALAAHIAVTSTDPTDAARRVGDSWGRDIVRRSGRRRERSALAARRAVVTMLAELGFAPSPDRRVSRVALRKCPLLDVALQHPLVVCQAHLGLVRGALDELGGDPGRTDLTPFAEPGACTLDLLTARLQEAPME